MSQQQARYSESPMVTNAQSHKKKKKKISPPISSEQRELGVLSLSLFWGGGGSALIQSHVGLFFTRCFSTRVVRLSNAFPKEPARNSIPADCPECLQCFDCKYGRETAVPEPSSPLNLLMDYFAVWPEIGQKVAALESNARSNRPIDTLNQS